MKRFTTFITESKKIEDLPTNKVAILFTDVKGSSKLWAKNEDSMYDSLSDLEELMNKIINENNGMVVKTIGDSFMCSYEEETALFDAIKTAISIQKSLTKKPIKSGKDKLQVRIGISYGDVYIRESKIQGVILKDYFGNTVNTASRMESKVSEVGSFAFSFLSPIENEEEILSYLEKEEIDIEVIEYNGDNCKTEEDRKRSARLLTDLQINSCESIKELQGVDPVRVYKCDL